MYLENLVELVKSWKKLASPQKTRSFVNRTVIFLGLTSLFTDISSEMIVAILPIYVIYGLNLGPVELGIVDGLYNGAAALIRLASGFITDRLRRYKEIATIGYALSAICRIGLLMVGNALTAISAVILIDRTGKGIRTAPRDALISLNSTPEKLGTSFGVHRALDTAGAMLGPLIAFGLLMLTPGAFDSIFVVSFIIALIGVMVIMFFVENPASPAISDTTKDDQTQKDSKVSLKSALSLLHIPRFRMLVLVGGILSLTTISDAFVFSGIQDRFNFKETFFPLLYVTTSLFYMLFAIPVGQLADRVGRKKIFISGYLLLLVLYVLLLFAHADLSPVFIFFLLFILGAYYATTDGVLMALASAFLPQNLRASGLSLVITITNLGRLFSSILFGLLWTHFNSFNVAAGIFLGALIVSIIIAVITLMNMERQAVNE